LNLYRGLDHPIYCQADIEKQKNLFGKDALHAMTRSQRYRQYRLAKYSTRQ
jgi:hypothetical protein